MGITKTAEAIKYFEIAIGDMREAISNKVERDEDYLNYKKEYYEKYGFFFLFFEHCLEFKFYQHKENKEFLEFFKINQKGEIVYNETNTFDGIEEIAKEAQILVSKFL